MHMKNSRNEKKFKNQSREIDKAKITCFSCRKKGHYARDCHSKSHGKVNHVPERSKGPNYSAFSSEIRRTVERSEEQTVTYPEVNISHKNNLKIWHERTGHINLKALCELTERGFIEKLDVANKEDFFCEGCQYGRQYRFSFNPREYKATKQGKLIYSGICGPTSVQSVGGASYVILLKDDYSGFRTVNFLKHKNDALEAFQKFAQLCENKFSHKIKALRVDNGTEYINLHFSDFLNKKDIQLETTAPYTPQQNERSERGMRTTVGIARSITYSKELPLYLWAEAVNTAIYILNRTPASQAPDSTLHELWTGKSTSLNHLRIFGSEAYMHVPDNLQKKLEPKSRKMIFVGYEKLIQLLKPLKYQEMLSSMKKMPI
ncbi:Retrovirus-related Pol polyprotein from transposon TNT 1-94 [Araneus ventricosus]|uniref:Retrovirus-related Pol polyprotein from transposon TNT 1-94 n=1 Tax=Araneus ventricosus TaxID=182803 RepID=A0A4Y2AKZ4_ARAVE|nr:Retrovirus-related Pol polyprotein from transposon TNT 1-94 [Araneus ventricosus]